jgi:hypothetical protein
MINAKLQNIIDTKSAIGNAIVNKGGTITSETPFFNYAAQIDGISSGTPQTIFAASDGSKWAFTNVVNLTNVSGNITYDFNRWQPANNSTSDPILNVGTVNGNISGNIRIVQVNQVNIAQYGNIVINDTTGAKYVGYNGYDAITNPTPTGNTTFNLWLLNNSASGTILFANTTVVTGGTFNGANTVRNENAVTFVRNSGSTGAFIETVAVNNGVVYVGGANQSNRVKGYRVSDLGLVSQSSNYGGSINAIAINNGHIYAGGGFGTSNNVVAKYGIEPSLGLVGNTANYGAGIETIAINNGFIYVAGSSTISHIKKYHESNLAFVGNTAQYNGTILSITTNNGFIYAGGTTNQTVQKYHESNLVRVGNTVNFSGIIRGVTINNGFIFIGGSSFGSDYYIRKYHESNLAFANDSDAFAFTTSIKTANGFVYVSTESGNISKFYEDNLSFLANSNRTYGGNMQEIAVDSTFVYAGGYTNNTVQAFLQNGITTADSQTFYTATKIKE